MSLDVMSYAWNNSKSKGTARLLLIAIADHANDNGDAFPGISRLAAKCNTSERAVQVAIRTLENAGEIKVYEGAGQRTISGWTNLYRVVIPGKQSTVYNWKGEVVEPRKPAQIVKHPFPEVVKTDSPLTTGVQTDSPHAVKTDSPDGVQTDSPKPSAEPPAKPSVKESLPGDTNVVLPPENEPLEEPDLTVYEDAVEALDMDDLEVPPTEPGPLESKAALQMSVTHTWNTNPDEWGKWNGLMRNFVTGRVDTKSKGTLWDKFKIDDPPMTPVEVVGFGLWYEDEFPDQEGIPKSLELLSQRIGLFRVAINYERACEVGRETLMKLMNIEAQSPLGESDELATEADLAEIEAALAAMRAGVQS